MADGQEDANRGVAKEQEDVGVVLAEERVVLDEMTQSWISAILLNDGHKT